MSNFRQIKRVLLHHLHEIESGPKSRSYLLALVVTSGTRAFASTTLACARLIARYSICFLSNVSLSVRRGEYVYSCGRESVIWDVQPLALKTNISARVNQLAEPKKLPPDHKEQR